MDGSYYLHLLHMFFFPLLLRFMVCSNVKVCQYLTNKPAQASVVKFPITPNFVFLIK